MTETIEVRTKAEGASLTHPCGAVATNSGGQWPSDQFTARRIVDGDIEKVPPAEAAPVVPPKSDDVDPKAARGKLQKD